MVAAEYTRLETDLNKGAAGHFVYLCYKKGRDEPPISDLCAPPLPMLLLGSLTTCVWAFILNRL